jgi:MarR family 2-MHQ and catechol resistance regulon transcriptional repressor
MKTNVKSYGEFADKSMRTWMQLYRAFNKIRSHETGHITSFGITMNQFEVLEVLYHRGDLNIGSITKLIMSTPGNVTVVVKNLKRDGLITSMPDPQDKRASILSITQKGKDVIEELFPSHAKNFEEYFKEFELDELDELFMLLRKLYKTKDIK